MLFQRAALYPGSRAAHHKSPPGSSEVVADKLIGCVVTVEAGACVRRSARFHCLALPFTASHCLSLPFTAFRCLSCCFHWLSGLPGSRVSAEGGGEGHTASTGAWQRREGQ